MYTTLNKIKSAGPCDRGWGAMLNYTGKSHGDDELVSMRVVLDAVGLFGAIWAIRTLEGAEDKRDEFTEFCSNGATQEQMTIKFLELFGD